MRRKLWVSLFLTVIVALLVNSALGVVIARHEVDEVFDAQLITTTRIIKSLINHSHVNTEADLNRVLGSLFSSVEQVPAEIQAYEKKILMQLWSADGRLLYRSPQSPDYALAPLQAGLQHVEGSRDHWPVFVTRLDDLNVWLLVGEIPDARAEIETAMNQIAIVSGILTLMICGFMISSAVRYGLGPLRFLSMGLRERRMNNLTPIRLESEPSELTPVIQSINQLFEQIAGGMERERRFVADAAHELRTPLAVMKLEVQQLVRQNPGAEKQNPQRLQDALARAEHSVEQLLLLARLEQNRARYDRVPVDMVELVRREVADAWSRAAALGIELAFDAAPGECVMTVNPALKAIAIRNLIDNAMKYGDGPIEVHIQQQADRVCIHIRDHGKGVDVNVLPRLQEAFFRNGRTDIAGAGLGLSIVYRIMEVGGGTLNLNNHPDGGLQVSLCWSVGNNQHP
jgi:two-component system, OmpR family, sensor histidine kinase QseC